MTSLRTGTTTRRQFLSAAAAGGIVLPFASSVAAAAPAPRKALLAITLDLEMSAQYPRREITEWNYEKGNLDDATKRYSVQAAQVAKSLGGLIHFFCVGRVLEQPSADWLKEIAAGGHPIGNHTYDHVHVKATTAADTQFRFQRAPWLVEGLSAQEVIRRNIRLTREALRTRAAITEQGFRTPGGFNNGLDDRPDLQQMLLDLGYSWISSKYPPHATGKPMMEPGPEVYDSIVDAQKNSQPYKYPNGLIEVPMSPISDVTAFRSNYWKLEYFLKAIRRAVESVIEQRQVFVLLAHPSCLVVEDPQFETIKLICELAKKAGDAAQIVDLSAIARTVVDQ